MLENMSLSDLSAIFRYNPKTGQIFWQQKAAKRISPAQVAGSNNGLGYTRIVYKKNKIMAHRLAWALYFGIDPDGDIDHINGIRSDNRIENLRIVTNRINQSNQSIHRYGRMVGATYKKTKGAWESQIQINKKKIHLGTFKDEASAHAAYLNARKAL